MSVNREALRLAVMWAVEANPEMSQREIARELGVSLGGVNYAMKALVKRGLVTAKKLWAVGQQARLRVRADAFGS